MFGKRFKQFRKALGLSQTDIATTLGIKPPAISQIEASKIKMSIENLEKISTTYNINLHWLLTGKGSMYTGRVQDLSDMTDTHSHISDDEASVTMPIVAEISAGSPVEAANEEPISFMNFDIDIVPFPEDYFVFKVNGRSMEPEILDGDTVVIQKTMDWANASFRICAVRVDGEITLKRLLKSKKGPYYILESINKDYEPIIVNPSESEFTLIGYLHYLLRQY